MNEGRMIYPQLMAFLPKYSFCRCVNRYQGNYRVCNFFCWDHTADFWIMPILGLNLTPGALIAAKGLAQ